MSRTAPLAILVIVLTGADRTATAQVFTTPKGEAENVAFKQIGGGTVHIVYDLMSSDPRAVFLVTLDASQDRGNTFTVRPTSVSGDVGPGIKPGTGKLIVWESGRDVERLEIDQFRFRISAQAGPLEPLAAPAPSSAAPPPVASTPAASAPAVPAPAAAPKGGSGAKWILIGGGAAAVAAGAAVGGGANSATQVAGGDVPTIATLATRTFTGSFTGTLVHNTNPTGRLPCTIDHAMRGDATMSLTIQGGTVTGSLRIAYSDTAVASTCGVIPENATGGDSFDGPVTGTPSALSFRRSTNTPHAIANPPGATQTVDATYIFSGAFDGVIVSGGLVFEQTIVVTVGGAVILSSNGRVTVPLTLR